MRQIDDVLISEETWELRFECNLRACRGECCRIGDMGAPVDEEEIERISNLFPQIFPYLPSKNVLFLKTGLAEFYKGKWNIREIGKNHPCPLGFVDDDGILKCSVHRFALDNNIPWQKLKPLWCQLFPLTITRSSVGWCLNSHVVSHCQSKNPASPVIISFSDVLENIFGKPWMEKVRVAYSEKT